MNTITPAAVLGEHAVYYRLPAAKENYGLLSKAGESLFAVAAPDLQQALSYINAIYIGSDTIMLPDTADVVITGTFPGALSLSFRDGWHKRKLTGERGTYTVYEKDGMQVYISPHIILVSHGGVIRLIDNLYTAPDSAPPLPQDAPAWLTSPVVPSKRPGGEDATILLYTPELLRSLSGSGGLDLGILSQASLEAAVAAEGTAQYSLRIDINVQNTFLAALIRPLISPLIVRLFDAAEFRTETVGTHLIWTTLVDRALLEHLVQ